MKALLPLLLCALAGLALVTLLPVRSEATAAPRRNILFIISDDLATRVGLADSALVVFTSDHGCHLG
jgi:hypothetical protein